MSADGVGKRIARLEASHSRRCEECGYASAEGYEVEWADGPEAVEPEACGKCGEPLVYVVTWGDEGEGVGR